jgi:hypothetical protein
MAKQQVTFEVELSDAQEQALLGLGGKEASQALADLSRIALTEWLGWLIADDRPASLTELGKRRVRALVEGHLLPRIPTAPVVAQRVRLTLGQARYIVSSMALEDPLASSETRDGLIHRLRDALVAAGVGAPDTLPPEKIKEISTDPANVEFDVPRDEADLALATHEEILNDKFSSSSRLEIDAFEPPQRRRRTYSYAQLEVRPHVAVEILQRLITEAKA